MHKIIASFALYTKLPLKHLRMRFVFFCGKQTHVRSPSSSFFAALLLKWLRSSSDQCIWCLCSHLSWIASCCSHLCRGQPTSPVSHVPLKFWSPQPPCLQEGLPPPQPSCHPFGFVLESVVQNVQRNTEQPWRQNFRDMILPAGKVKPW